jgi:type II secretory pathway predicted ATPase ExeA
MYQSFYGLDRPPFAATPEPGALFLSPQHRKALSMLELALMARGGFCVVTGEVGAGKTTLVRRLLQGIDEDIQVGLVTNTQCDSFVEFLQWVLLAFDLDYRSKTKVELYDEFVSFLISQYQRGRPVTLVIDEAQHLGPEYLEQLRMLSNVNTERGEVLQTILVGQPELWDLLRDPGLEQFAQRITYDCFLGPLESPELVRQYVDHRLQFANGDPAIIADETIETIWRASRGVPRLINLICNTALVYGYAEEKRVIDLQIIENVLNDKAMSFAPLESNARNSRGTTRGRQRSEVQRRSTIERAASLRKDNT